MKQAAYVASDKESEILNDYLSCYFAEGISEHEPTSDEFKVIEAIIEDVWQNVSKKKRPIRYVLGLALDFTLLAQQVSHYDSDAKGFRPTLTENDLFKRYQLVKSRAGVTANTLTVECSNQKFGIRKIEESIGQLFHGSLNRTDFPSAYVYNTGQWKKYKELLVNCFRLSENGRFLLCQELFLMGLVLFPENKFFGRNQPRIRLFDTIVEDYLRTHSSENGGLVYQALAYGYISADRPHLDLIADKVRTGSSRQKRFGDIDCYCGLDLELSVEVKDMAITTDNVEKELGSFETEVVSNRILGVAFVKIVSTEVRTRLAGNNVSVIEQDDMLATLKTWDWPKLNAALQSSLHYLAHIEQNTSATVRLLDFIYSKDPSHDSLVYFSKGN